MLASHFFSDDKIITCKHYVAAFVFMFTWMGGSPINKPPSLPLSDAAPPVLRKPLPTLHMLTGTVTKLEKDVGKKYSNSTDPSIPSTMESTS